MSELDDAWAPWREVVIAATDYVNARRHDRYTEIPKTLRRLEDAVDAFLADNEEGP